MEAYIYSCDPAAGTILVSFWVGHRLSWQEGVTIWADMSRLLVAIKEMMIGLGIEVAQPPLPVALGAPQEITPSLGVESRAALLGGQDRASGAVAMQQQQ